MSLHNLLLHVSWETMSLLINMTDAYFSLTSVGHAPMKKKWLKCFDISNLYARYQLGACKH